MVGLAGDALAVGRRAADMGLAAHEDVVRDCHVLGKSALKPLVLRPEVDAAAFGTVEHVVRDRAVRRAHPHAERAVASEVAAADLEAVALRAVRDHRVAAMQGGGVVHRHANCRAAELVESAPESDRRHVRALLRRHRLAHADGLHRHPRERPAVCGHRLRRVARMEDRRRVLQQAHLVPFHLVDNSVHPRDVHRVVAVVQRRAAEDLRAHHRATAHERVVVATPQALQPALREVRLRRTPHDAAVAVDVRLGEVLLEGSPARRRIGRDVLERAAHRGAAVDRVTHGDVVALHRALRRRHAPHRDVAHRPRAVAAARDAVASVRQAFKLEARAHAHGVLQLQRVLVVDLERPSPDVFPRRARIAIDDLQRLRAVLVRRHDPRLRERQVAVV